MRAADLFNFGASEIVGDKDRKVEYPYSILDKATTGKFAFCEKKRIDNLTGEEKGVLIVPMDAVDLSPDVTYVLAERPRLVFLRALIKMVEAGELKKGDVKIGQNVSIHPTTVIGADGFSPVVNEKGKKEWFPQLGGVIIEDNVVMGVNNVINRGSLGNTVIGHDTHIAHGAVIGHNCQIGADVFIASASLCGSVKLGNDCHVGPHAVVNQYIELGQGVVVGSGAIVTKDFKEQGTVLVGIPARPLNKRRES